MREIIGIDHVYISVADLARSSAFYDRLMPLLGFRRSTFTLGDAPHVQYYNRHFGYVLRPARRQTQHDAYAPGLHHFCLRVDSIADVVELADELRAAGFDASEAAPHAEYADDYWATHLIDPDGIRLEITNYREERRIRHDYWADAHTESEPEAIPTPT